MAQRKRWPTWAGRSEVADMSSSGCGFQTPPDEPYSQLLLCGPLVSRQGLPLAGRILARCAAGYPTLTAGDHTEETWEGIPACRRYMWRPGGCQVCRTQPPLPVCCVLHYCPVLRNDAQLILMWPGCAHANTTDDCRPAALLFV